MIRKYVFLFILFVLFGFACRSIEQKKFEKSPYYKSFYRTTRFIMTDYEKKIYRFLPDNKAIEDFIKDFWKRRDPTPNTEENENYDEFLRRIAYANKYFRERTRGLGWNTNRGRILLQLGFPLQRRREQYNLQSETRYVPYEIWYYPRFELVLGFIDRGDTGKYELLSPPPGLLSAIDEAIYEFDINKKYRGKFLFKFKGKYKKNKLIFTFPVKNILFKELENKMKIKYKFDISVFLNYKKIDFLSITKTIEKKKEELLKLNKLHIDIPYNIRTKGKYYFDVLVTDLINNTRHRRYISYRN